MGSRNPVHVVDFRAFSHVQMISSECDLPQATMRLILGFSSKTTNAAPSPGTKGAGAALILPDTQQFRHSLPESWLGKSEYLGKAHFLPDCRMMP